jgi:hypothetical protein
MPSCLECDHLRRKQVDALRRHAELQNQLRTAVHETDTAFLAALTAAEQLPSGIETRLKLP